MLLCKTGHMPAYFAHIHRRASYHDQNITKRILLCGSPGDLLKDTSDIEPNYDLLS